MLDTGTRSLPVPKNFTPLPAKFDDSEDFRIFNQSGEDAYNYHHINSQWGQECWAKELWRETLKLALEDYQTFFKTVDFEEIFNWFFNSTSTEPGSFLYVCEALSIPPKSILKQLLLWTKNNN